jgi:3-deoxy-7-phosphoheptulonate synthase
MIVVMSGNATKQEIENVEKKLQELGFKTHPIIGKNRHRRHWRQSYP